MPTFRAEYNVHGDIVLPNSVVELKVSNKEGYSIVLRNGALDSEGHVSALIGLVVGNSDSIDTAEKHLRDILAAQLDLLSFVTHSRFKIVSARRVIEWDENRVTRKFKSFLKKDAKYPPDPELLQDYLNTTELLDGTSPPPFSRVALKYFRQGVLEGQLTDQFMRFWLALEIIAENTKDKFRAPISCPACKANLKCITCDTEPTRVPMATQAITELIEGYAAGEAKEVRKRQFIARNGLMHGRSVESIEKECEVKLEVIVNQLAAIAWNAIMSTFPHSYQESNLVFAHRDGDFSNPSVIVGLVGEFDHTAEAPHPAEDKLPNVEITMETSFERQPNFQK